MPIVFDDAVKKPKEEFEYTLEQVKEIQKCEEDFFYFCSYVKVKHPDLGRVVFEPRWYQKEFLEQILNNRYIIGLLSRQVGKTVSVSVYILWYAIFNKDKTIGIVSNKEKSAKKILNEIKKMYESLHYWIKPGVKEYNKTSVEFENGSKIMVSATTEDPFRGESLNVLFADEFAFVRHSIASDFWSSNFPTLSASEESKVIIVSTPNGMFNLFHQIYMKAVNGENGFAHCHYNWRVIEGRDEEWKRQQIKVLGKRKFLQEHSCKFLGSSNTVINSEKLESLMAFKRDPELIDLQDRLRIYEKPQDSYTYIIGCDPSKGSGEHDASIQILKILTVKPTIKMEQVAVFQSNLTDTYEFSGVVDRLSKYYNNAWIFIENNAEGSTVAQNLHWIFENSNMYNSGNKMKDIGIRATTITKVNAVIHMKKLIEDDCLFLYDEETINQLASFVEVKTNIFKGKGLGDDLVSGLYWACYIIETELIENLKQNMVLNSINSNEEESNDIWGILSDVNEDTDDEFAFMDRLNW